MNIKNSLKSVGSVFLALVLLVAFSFSASAQSEKPRDSRHVGWALLKSGLPDYYNAYFGYNLLKPDGTSQWVEGTFVATIERGEIKAISAMFVDNVAVPIKAPLTAFPHDARGNMLDFYVSLFGIKSGTDPYYGTPVTQSYFNTPRLYDGDPINFVIKPYYVVAHVSAPKVKNTSDLVLELPNGNRYGYNSYTGGFDIYLDPVDNFDEQEYTIKSRSTGLVIAGGTISSYHGAHQSSGSVFGSQFELGVESVPISNSDSFRWFESQTLDGQVTIDGVTYSSKTYFFTELANGNVVATFMDVVPSRVVFKVEEVLDDGTIVPAISKGFLSGDNRIEVRTSGSYKSLMITIYTASAKTVAYSSYFSWNYPGVYYGGGGGGKGIVVVEQ